MNDTKIHRQLDALFFRILNDVLRQVDRPPRGGTLRIERRTRLTKKLWLELRVRLTCRKGGAA